MNSTTYKSNQLPLSHLLLALSIVAVWGTNFVVIKVSLESFPPFLFAALRFFFALLPLIFFIPRPKVSWINLCVYGLAIGVGQFGVLFFAIDGHISPGLASLVVQTQVFFTIGLAMFFAKEKIQLYQAVAVVIAMTGLGVIAVHTDASTTVLGIVAPAPLLVPIFGMGAAAFFLSEPLPFWKILAAGLVITGLVINLFWPSLEKWVRKLV